MRAANECNRPVTSHRLRARSHLHVFYHMHVDGSGPAACSASNAACSSVVDGDGCRLLTALIYCSTLRREDGGATRFDFDDGSSARVVPRRGNVVLFPADVRHAIETLSRGEKVSSTCGLSAGQSRRGRTMSRAPSTSWWRPSAESGSSTG